MPDHQTPATDATPGGPAAGTRGLPEPGGEQVPPCSAGSPRPRRRNRSGQIGTATETAVVRYLQTTGWPYAERRRLKGAHDEGDITGTPGIVWEVKGGQAARTASDAVIDAWLADTETERVNAQADLGILVVARAGIGPARVGTWWAIVPWWAVMRLALGNHDVAAQPVTPSPPVRMLLGDLVAELRAGGYGSLFPPEVPR